MKSLQKNVQKKKKKTEVRCLLTTTLFIALLRYNIFFSKNIQKYFPSKHIAVKLGAVFWFAEKNMVQSLYHNEEW